GPCARASPQGRRRNMATHRGRWIRNFSEHVMNRRHRAFSLLELLVSIAIIMVLVGLLLVSLRGVKASATRTDSLNSLREMSLAYSQYSDEHRKRLMPGYIGENLFADGEPFENLIVKLPAGEVLDPEDAQSYVWRLAPYVDHAWETFFTDTRDQGLLSELHGEFGNGIYGPGTAGANEIGISERPAYGLNSIFVGGDSFHGGSEVTPFNPWNTLGNDPIAATRFSEVKNPSRLIIFAPTAKAGTGDEVYEDPELGFCELRPPYLVLDDPSPSGEWIDAQWTVGVGGLVEQTVTGQYASGAGLPIARSGKNLMPVAHLDGSAVVEQISDISRDMRRWDPFEVGRRVTR
ncbi:MAG: prepilin-type N-terminal cleavage/methylation domain-containing protein, partial [Planctomycetota bacterium]|nr:prepilin-type N-terminal cleavage/methylation domain-containing protein [Planctomycetota bacterium]